MIFRKSDFSDSQTYIDNPIKNLKTTFHSLFSNAISISEKTKHIEANQNVLILVQDESTLIASIISCWINSQFPAIYSPNINQEEYNILEEKHNIAYIISDTKVEINIKNVENIITQYDFNYLINDFNIELDYSQIALVLFSSGTTGVPKAIPLSFTNIISNINSFTDRLLINNESKFLCASPLWHAHGLYNSFLTCLFLRTTVIYCGKLSILNIRQLFDKVLEETKLIFHITPSMIPIILAYVKRSDKFTIPSFYRLICGTSFLDISMKKEIENILGIQLIQQYGMTETLFISVNDKFAVDKPYSVGAPLSNVKIELKNCYLRDGNLEGVIYLKSNSWFGSYLGGNRTELELFCTGDIGYLDSDGCLFITGREKDLIKKGGFSISANELSSHINTIEDIEEVFVLSVTDKRLGEEIYCFYTSNSSIENRTFIQSLHNKVPKNLIPKLFIKIDNFPKTESGKINRVELMNSLKLLLDD